MRLEDRFNPGMEPSTGRLLAALEASKRDLKLDVSNGTIRATVHSDVFIEDIMAQWLASQWDDYDIVVESHRGTFRAGKHVAGVVRVT